jgi:hypothetical protein
MRSGLAFLALVATPAMAAPGFAPGQWNHQTQLLSADVPGIPEWVVKMFAGRGHRTSCNSAEQLRAHPEALLTEDDAAICKLRKLLMANGRLVFDTFCTNKRFPDGLLVASRGSYTPTSYAISTTSTGTRNGRPVRILTKGGGQQVSASCSKPS